VHPGAHPNGIAWVDRRSLIDGRDGIVDNHTATRIQLGGLAIDVDSVDVVGEVRLLIRAMYTFRT
jgi:hypothetical protein